MLNSWEVPRGEDRTSQNRGLAAQLGWAGASAPGSRSRQSHAPSCSQSEQDTPHGRGHTRAPSPAPSSSTPVTWEVQVCWAGGRHFSAFIWGVWCQRHWPGVRESSSSCTGGGSLCLSDHEGRPGLTAPVSPPGVLNPSSFRHPDPAPEGAKPVLAARAVPGRLGTGQSTAVTRALRGLPGARPDSKHHPDFSSTLETLINPPEGNSGERLITPLIVQFCSSEHPAAAGSRSPAFPSMATAGAVHNFSYLLLSERRGHMAQITPELQFPTQLFCTNTQKQVSQRGRLPPSLGILTPCKETGLRNQQNVIPRLPF